MSSNKDSRLKEFLASQRKSIGSGLGSAPVWIFQKANRRIWNPVQKRHWKLCDFGKKFRKRLKEG